MSITEIFKNNFKIYRKPYPFSRKCGYILKNYENGVVKYYLPYYTERKVKWSNLVDILLRKTLKIYMKKF